MVARAKGQEPDNVAQWLETELLETKARLAKVEGEFDQAIKQIWTLQADLRKLMEMLNVTGSASSQVGAFREELRQVREQLGRIQDRQTAISNRTDEILRQRQSESSREKQDVTTLGKQIDALSRSLDGTGTRLQSVEESLRRAEDDLAGVRLTGQALERSFEELSGRSARSLEAAGRVEQDIARTLNDLDSLRKSDQQLEDKIRMILEQSRRISERVDKLEDFSDFPEEARELLNRAHAEREQMAQRIALIEKLTNEFAEETQQVHHAISRLDQRQQVQNAQIMDLLGRVQEMGELMESRMKRVYQVLLRQRRRQMDTLAQEIKELGQSGLPEEQ
jgi:chromosome segregation ATPase